MVCRDDWSPWVVLFVYLWECVESDCSRVLVEELMVVSFWQDSHVVECGEFMVDFSGELVSEVCVGFLVGGGVI